jgi:hypothetical protein
MFNVDDVMSTYVFPLTSSGVLSTRPHSRKAIGNLVTLVCALVGKKGSAFAQIGGCLEGCYCSEVEV